MAKRAIPNLDAYPQGLELHRLGQWQRAEALFEQVVATHPRHAAAWAALGLIAGQTGRFARAAELFAKAVQLDPGNADAHHNLGRAQHELGRREAALASFDRTLALQPAHALAHQSRGIVLAAMGRHEAALESFDRAIVRRPQHAPLHYNRGNSLQALRRTAAALEAFERAIAVQPDFAEAHLNKGLLLHETGELEAALQAYDRALAARAQFAEAYNNRGNVLRDMKRLAAARADYDRALELKPQYAEAVFNRSLVLLAHGDFERGWAEHEWRLRLPHRPLARRAPPIAAPRWTGAEPLGGKTLLLTTEQGLGDTLQFCRYVPLLAGSGARVVLEVQRPLLNLLAGIAGVAEVVALGDLPPACDFHCELMSLPWACRTTLATVPAQVPYVAAPAGHRHVWRERLGERSRPRVGLVWSGGFRPGQPETWVVNNRRNVPLEQLALLAHPGIEFFSLQKGEAAEAQLAALRERGWDGPALVDPTALFRDFADTAALVEQLDLVISVDTSTAHLAGALGKPVWILLRYDACWRWLLERRDSPWYPTARLYRQPAPGAWSPVIQEVARDLDAFLAAPGAT